MKNNLSVLMETILDAPVWVQEVIYIDIKRNLEKRSEPTEPSTNDAQIYPVFVPEVTFIGKQELETHENNLDFNIYKYLQSAMENLRVVDITLDNFWTLEESSKYLAECIRREFLKAPSDITLNAAISYLAGDIRIGEYVKRINKINVEELDDILRKQKQYNLENPDAKLKTGEIMVNMGYVANKDIDTILHTKDEAKKRFILPGDAQQSKSAPVQSGLNSVVSSSNKENDEKIKDIILLNQKLSAENKLLKDKLRAIFNIQNKNK